MAYQDSVTASIGREHNDDAVGQEDDDDDNPDLPPTPEGQEVILWEVSSAVRKVRNHSIYVHFPQLMLSSMGFKNLFASLFALFQTTYQLIWSLVWQELIANWATTMGNLMIPHTILGLFHE